MIYSNKATNPHDLLGEALALRAGYVASSSASQPWQSATFTGARHFFTFPITTAEAEQRLIDGLADAEFNLPGHIVADIVLADRSSGQMTIEALTVEDAW
jgi:hypothetical protein